MMYSVENSYAMCRLLVLSIKTYMVLSVYDITMLCSCAHAYTSSRYMFRAPRNAGKVFKPTTVTFDYWVEMATQLLCCLLIQGPSLRDRLGVDRYVKSMLGLIDFYGKHILPRFYQDALHVRNELIICALQGNISHELFIDNILGIYGNVKKSERPRMDHQRLTDNKVAVYSLSYVAHSFGCDSVIYKNMCSIVYKKYGYTHTSSGGSSSRASNSGDSC